ncbi:MAG TPA: hypothetical protein VN088_18645, partial [Nocardioides sp.]|nr:hypothetical protein [Nocardioides sp.]
MPSAFEDTSTKSLMPRAVDCESVVSPVKKLPTPEPRVGSSPVKRVTMIRDWSIAVVSPGSACPARPVSPPSNCVISGSAAANMPFTSGASRWMLVSASAIAAWIAGARGAT